MIDLVRIRNFRCLREVDLRLTPLTILLGPNASGKSAVLDALQPDERAAQRQAFNVWQRRTDLEVKIEYEVQEGRGRREVEKFVSKKITLDLAALRSRNHMARSDSLSENGSGLTNRFDSLTRTQQSELARQFCKLIPIYGDVDRRPVGEGLQILIFQDRWNKDLWYTPDQVSDGSILILAYLLLQYEQPPVDLLGIEEPERGIHPWLLGTLVTLFRAMAHGKLGQKAMQIVLATHSPQILDFARPEEVRFLSRNSADGSVKVEEPPVDDEGWAQSIKEYDDSLGQMWLYGGLGGVPGG